MKFSKPFGDMLAAGLFLKDKVDRQDQEHEAYQMIHLEGFLLEEDRGKEDKYQQGNHFLYHFQLNQRKGSPVAFKTNTVGRHLQAVFKQGDTPADQDHNDEGHLVKAFHLLEL